jgi:hypothetical protein
MSLAAQRILVVASLSGIATANYMVRALRRAGHELLVVSDVPSQEADLAGESTPDVAAICAARGFAPQLALFIEGGSMQLFPMGLERVPCPTAWYGIDTHMDYRRHLRIGRLFDVTFIAQKQYVDGLRADGLAAVHWLPLAFPSEWLDAGAAPDGRTLDVAFVGSSDPGVHPERARLLDLVRGAAAHCEIGTATPEQMLRRYRRAKAVFNRSVNNDVNMRYFEAMGSGAVLITDPAVGNGAEDLFDDGSYLRYRNDEELTACIRFVLGSPEQALAMATRAQARVEREHTYDHRVGELIRRMAGRTKGARPAAGDYFPALASLNMAGAALRSVSHELAQTGAGGRRRLLNRLAARVVAMAAVLVELAVRPLAVLRRKRLRP